MKNEKIKIENKKDFNKFREEFWKKKGNKEPLGFGIGIADLNENEEIIDIWYPVINYLDNYGAAAVLQYVLGSEGGTISEKNYNKIMDMFFPFLKEENHKNINLLKKIRNTFLRKDIKVIVTFLPNNSPPQNIENIYLKLHIALSKKIPFEEFNFQGADTFLKNLAWTTKGPKTEQDLIKNKILFNDFLKIHYKGKFGEDRLTSIYHPEFSRMDSREFQKMSVCLFPSLERDRFWQDGVIKKFI